MIGAARVGLVAGAALIALAAFDAPIDATASYPEGPLYLDGRLYYAEMGADRVSMIVGGAKRTFWREAGCGPTAMAPYGDDLAILCHEGERFAIVSRAGKTLGHVGLQPGEVFARTPVGAPNDGYSDGRGGVYYSDPGPFSKQSTPRGAVMRLGADGAVTRLAGGLWYPNGIYHHASSRTLYVSEHLARRILAFPVLADGTLGPAKTYAKIDDIAPKPTTPFYAEAGVDGLEMAPNGDIVVALYGEGRLIQIDPQGRLRRVIPVPFPYVTNVAFAPNGDAAVVGAFINDRPPFRGQVIRLPAATFGN